MPLTWYTPCEGDRVWTSLPGRSCWPPSPPCHYREGHQAWCALRTLPASSGAGVRRGSLLKLEYSVKISHKSTLIHYFTSILNLNSTKRVWHYGIVVRWKCRSRWYHIAKWSKMTAYLFWQRCKVSQIQCWWELQLRKRHSSERGSQIRLVWLKCYADPNIW